MKCTCKQCNGNGHVECDSCNGSGQVIGGIDDISLSPTHESFDGIQALKADADRCRSHAAELTRLRPLKSEFYKDQLEQALESIEELAEELLTKPKTK